MRGDVLQDLEKCVRCGSCKAVCPTHVHTGLEPLGARGRMVLLHALQHGTLRPSELLNQRIWSCTLCAVCEDACPAGVGVTEAIYRGRERLRPSDGRRRLLRAAARVTLKRPRLGFSAARLLGPLIPRLLGRADFPFRVELPDEPLRDGPKIYKPGRSRGRVAVFTGCSVNYLYPELGLSLINVLLKSGYEAVLPPGEVCCGEPLRALGLEGEAAKLARRNSEVFGKLRADAVVSLCPTCTLALKVHYPALIGEGIENAMDASEFLHDKLSPASAPGAGGLAYHNPCHLQRLGVTKEPHSVLRTLGHGDVGGSGVSCCGFSISLWDRELSDKLLAGSLGEFGGSGTLVTACPGCMMQFSRRHPNVRHIIELIEEGVAGQA